jgi:hypothetical protein
MSLAEIKSPDSIRKAVSEFDRLGRTAFLERYGFCEAREYLLDIDGRLYDSKAIVGAAHAYEFPLAGPLRAGDFSGGEATVTRKLEELGFTVRRLPAAPTERAKCFSEAKAGCYLHP